MSDSYNFISKTRVLFGAGELDAIAANGLATNGALFAHDPAPLSHDDVLDILRKSYRWPELHCFGQGRSKVAAFA